MAVLEPGFDAAALLVAVRHAGSRPTQTPPAICGGHFSQIFSFSHRSKASVKRFCRPSDDDQHQHLLRLGAAAADVVAEQVQGLVALACASSSRARSSTVPNAPFALAAVLLQFFQPVHERRDLVELRLVRLGLPDQNLAVLDRNSA